MNSFFQKGFFIKLLIIVSKIIFNVFLRLIEFLRLYHTFLTSCTPLNCYIILKNSTGDVTELKKDIFQENFPIYQISRAKIYSPYSNHKGHKTYHSHHEHTSMGVDNFFSHILSYFCFFVAALRPCHGRLKAVTNESVRSYITHFEIV